MPYIVMRYVSGGTLNDLIASDLPTPTQSLRFTWQIANGLEEAHAHGVFHRDLKPANVLYDQTTARMLLADFGVARWVDATHTLGGTPGTPAYMAPEQWGPGGPFGNVSARTDVYCLGVILFQLLTGTRLFNGIVWDLMNHHCKTPPRHPSAVRPDLDKQLDELCLKALAKHQNDRYESAKAFADAIAKYMRTSTAQQTTAQHTTAQHPGWRVLVPGEWFARTVGDNESEWYKITNTPAEIVPRPGEVYRFSVSGSVRDAALANVAHLNGIELQWLDLSACDRITDVGIAHLKSLTTLHTLTLLGGRGVTDAGLAHLSELTDLRLLLLLGCDQITHRGMSALERALPNCRISRLGLSGEQDFFAEDGARR